MNRREAVGSLGRRSLRVDVRRLRSRLSSLRRGREGVVQGLRVPTREIKVVVCARHVCEQLRFRHVIGVQKPATDAEREQPQTERSALVVVDAE